MDKNIQTNFWEGEFGTNYTKRNTFDYKVWNGWFIDNYGINREEMNLEFLNDLDRNIKILEVGCNIGQQLYCLQKLGFENLFGIEIQKNVVEEAKSRYNNIHIIKGSALNIPFKDNYFDLVFTNGVLIHIAPDNLKTVMAEMIRCTKRFIWGLEYYSKELQEIPYRGNKNVLWKADYCSMFLNLDNNLKLNKKKDFKYISKEHKGNVDRMYLIEK